MKELEKRKYFDADGHPLESGIYFGRYLKGGGELYFISINNDDFSKPYNVDSREGLMPIGDHELFAKQLIKLDHAKDNINFARSRLRRGD